MCVLADHCGQPVGVELLSDGRLDVAAATSVDPEAIELALDRRTESAPW